MDLRSWDKAQPNDSLHESNPFERVEINHGNGLMALGAALMQLRVDSPEKRRRAEMEYHSSPSSHPYNMRDSVIGSPWRTPRNILLSSSLGDADDSSVTDCSIPSFVHKYRKRSIHTSTQEDQDTSDKSESFTQEGEANEVIRPLSPPHKRARRYQRRNSVVIPEETSKLLRNLILSPGDVSWGKQRNVRSPSWFLLGIPPVPFDEMEQRRCPLAVGEENSELSTKDR
jgi:hypothetical protein